VEGWSFLDGYRQLREAQTEASGRLPGTPVQRLAAIPRGDGRCTAHLTAPSLVHIRTTVISIAADVTATGSGGISA
jgi:hypothetical protein